MTGFVRREYERHVGNDALHRKHRVTRSVVQSDSGQIYEPEDLEPGYGRDRLRLEPDQAEIEELLEMQSRCSYLSEPDMENARFVLEGQLRRRGWLPPQFHTVL